MFSLHIGPDRIGMVVQIEKGGKERANYIKLLYTVEYLIDLQHLQKKNQLLRIE